MAFRGDWLNYHKSTDSELCHRKKQIHEEFAVKKGETGLPPLCFSWNIVAKARGQGDRIEFDCIGLYISKVKETFVYIS